MYFLLKNRDFPASHVSFRGCNASEILREFQPTTVGHLNGQVGGTYWMATYQLTWVASL